MPLQEEVSVLWSRSECAFRAMKSGVSVSANRTDIPTHKKTFDIGIEPDHDLILVRFLFPVMLS